MELSKLSTRRIPLFSARRPLQKLSRPIPTEVMGPRPVITARLIGENPIFEARNSKQARSTNRPNVLGRDLVSDFGFPSFANGFGFRDSDSRSLCDSRLEG